MLRISFQTLRAHRGTLAGAFVAIWLAVTLAYATGLLMDGALSAPGPGRFAAADAVVRADPSIATADGESEDVVPAPRLDAALRASASPGGRRRRLVPGRRVDAAGAAGSAATAARPRLGERRAHAVRAASPAARRPAPTRSSSTRGSRVGAARARRDPGGRGDLPRHAAASAALTRRDRPTLFFAPASHAIAVTAAPGVTPDEVNAIARDRRAVARGAAAAARRAAGRRAPRSRCSTATTRADADAGDPRAADRAALVAIFGDDGRDRRRRRAVRRRRHVLARDRPAARARSRCCARSAPRRIRCGG